MMKRLLQCSLSALLVISPMLLAESSGISVAAVKTLK